MKILFIIVAIVIFGGVSCADSLHNRLGLAEMHKEKWSDLGGKESSVRLVCYENEMDFYQLVHVSVYRFGDCLVVEAANAWLSPESKKYFVRCSGVWVLPPQAARELTLLLGSKAFDNLSCEKEIYEQVFSRLQNRFYLSISRQKEDLVFNYFPEQGVQTVGAAPGFSLDAFDKFQLLVDLLLSESGFPKSKMQVGLDRK